MEVEVEVEFRIDLTSFLIFNLLGLLFTAGFRIEVEVEVEVVLRLRSATEVEVDGNSHFLK